MSSGIILWMVPVVLLAAVLVGAAVVMQKIKRFSRGVFGTDSLAEGLERQADELALTPKSVSAMTRIFAPQLQKDFPEFHLEEFEDKVENVLVAALQAISAGTSFAGGISENAEGTVKLSEAKARWGSCSTKNNLNFSWRLVMCPLSVIDYVAVHELSHITYKNHSPAFWARVKTVLPTYEDDQEWLKANRKLMEII